MATRCSTATSIGSIRRQFEIAGYVNTSRGRVDTTVKQEHLLTNAQWVEPGGL